MFKPFLSLSFVPAQKCSKQLIGIEAVMADAFVHKQHIGALAALILYSCFYYENSCLLPETSLMRLIMLK